MSETQPPVPPGPRRRKGRPILTALVVLALPPFGAVLIHRFVPVPYTLLMIREGLAGNGLDYRWKPLRDISPNLVASAIAAEDARFCSHGGFDFEAIEKALKDNEQGRRIRGGSTISQQTAKNVFLWPGRDWVRKGLEAGYTVLIETGWGKRRIMEVYLNVAEMGPGVYGAEAAARHWFGKSAADLTPREAARLAAILPSPRRYDAGTPGPYVRRRASRIQASARVVRNEGLAACVL
ncbi:monofunctional biosynthetic peptidoglycan transglycosylase [Brevundimonas subvibrioides]|uniref:Biosynthetic peptidoglycan transglycosylase n=1 Tax=Brevundimonas subvibrioides (strain ATCC 15264 / DSM 4735 / LMG 14903 / NBRC 16000 / CB 81) TaxID=633149 RepID=D9QND5_BRESC|nr:monofunctional biosynthetic peptidoglycan transglycosylase [Brevundimonas subvibrioides]ADL00336.1 monofunctional biosynthetic peptidoglycan transglycosylase [Brevundimonas subvibrioides ATCC 15264]